MALIKCPECGKENVSDGAMYCPECGFGIKEYFEKIEKERLQEEKREQKRIEEDKQKELEKQEKIRSVEEVEKKKSLAQYKLRKLEKDVVERQKRVNICMAITALCLLATIILYISGWNSLEDIYIKFSIIFFLTTAFLIFITIRERLLLSSAKENFENGKDKFQALEKGQNVNIDMMDLSPITGFEYIPLKGISYIGVQCPVCHSVNVKRISTTNRVISVSAVGLASSKIGKQYKCNDCSHMW